VKFLRGICFFGLPLFFNSIPRCPCVLGVTLTPFFSRPCLPLYSPFVFKVAFDDEGPPWRLDVPPSWSPPFPPSGFSFGVLDEVPSGRGFLYPLHRRRSLLAEPFPFFFPTVFLYDRTAPVPCARFVSLLSPNCIQSLGGALCDRSRDQLLLLFCIHLPSKASPDWSLPCFQRIHPHQLTSLPPLFHAPACYPCFGLLRHAKKGYKLRREPTLH